MKKLTQILAIAIISLSMMTATSVAQDKKPAKKSCCSKSLECKTKKPCTETKSSDNKTEKVKEEKSSKNTETKKENKTK